MHNNESITSVNFHGSLTNSHCARFCVKAQLSGGFEEKLDEKLSLSEDQRIRRPSSRGPRLGIVIGPKSRMELPPSLPLTFAVATSHCANCSLCTLHGFCHAWRSRFGGKPKPECQQTKLRPGKKQNNAVQVSILKCLPMCYPGVVKRATSAQV